MRKKKGERNSVCRKNNGTLFPLMFWIIQDIRNIFAMFPSPLSPVLFACLFFFPLSSSFTSLHSNSLISPSQFKQGVRPSPIYFSYDLFFFSFFLASIALHSLWSSLPIFRSADTSNVAAHRLVFPSVTRNQPVYPVICTPRVQIRSYFCIIVPWIDRRIIDETSLLRFYILALRS